jgi:predicted nucleic-acid-binding protein
MNDKKFMYSNLFVSATVVLELEWVLRSCYRFKKADVLAVFSIVMSSVELELESEDAMEQALADYEEGNADFADYFHIAIAKKWDALPFMTFDELASKTHGAKLLV